MQLYNQILLMAAEMIQAGASAIKSYWLSQ